MTKWRVEKKNLAVWIVTAVVLLAGVYVSLPGRYHFLGDVKKATATSGVAYGGVSGHNALDLLKQSHTVETKNYPGIGDYVVSIDGVKPDSAHFWAFQINGKDAQVGASSYITKNTDILGWKLESTQ